MNLRLRNKRVLTTGGSCGICADIVSRPARESADLALTYINRPREAENTAASVRKIGTRVLTIQADSAMPGAVAAAVDKAADVFDGVDILVNNARIASMDSIDRLSLEEFDRTVAINVRAVFVATQAAIKHMKEGSCQRRQLQRRAQAAGRPRCQRDLRHPAQASLQVTSRQGRDYSK